MTQEQEKALGVVQKLIDNISNYPITSEEILILIKGILSNESGPSYPIYTPSPSTPPFIKPGDIYCKSAIRSEERRVGKEC